MNEPFANTTRAAHEVARVALGRMMGAPPAAGAPRTVPITMAARASEAWKATEIFLRALIARPDLAGQALVTEARQLDKLDMEGTHALVAMREWVERTLAPGSAAQMLTLPPTDAERAVAANALAALDRAMGIAGAATSPSLPNSDTAASVAGIAAAQRLMTSEDSASPWAPKLPGDVQRSERIVMPNPTSTWFDQSPQASVRPPASSAQQRQTPSPPSTADRALSNVGAGEFPAEHTPNRSFSSGLIVTVLLLVIAVAGAGAWFALRGKTQSSATQEGVDAYTRGAKEAARISLAKAIEQNPQDVRALTYLGRVAREQGDLATARKYLENAIRVDPNNELALRELASALLADGQYELSRRFYVRALNVDPTDRIAQGFLGCALTHLNRNEEAARWTQRAGPGDWSSCATSSSDPPAKE